MKFQPAKIAVISVIAATFSLSAAQAQTVAPMPVTTGVTTGDSVTKIAKTFSTPTKKAAVKKKSIFKKPVLKKKPVLVKKPIFKKSPKAVPKKKPGVTPGGNNPPKKAPPKKWKPKGKKLPGSGPNTNPRQPL